MVKFEMVSRIMEQNSYVTQKGNGYGFSIRWPTEVTDPDDIAYFRRNNAFREVVDEKPIAETKTTAVSAATTKKVVKTKK